MAASKSVVSQLIAVIFLCSQVTHVASVEGRLFFLAFMDPSPSTNPNSGVQEIHISGSENADSKVRVQFVSLNKTYMYMLNSTNKWRQTITVFDDLAGPPGEKLPVSFIISSEKNISVQANKAEDGTSGGYLALPITVAGTQYYVASYTPRGKAMSFSIAAPYHTCVTVYKQNGPDQVREMDIGLDPGQVFHYTPTAAGNSDLTGYYVESMKPIAVFSGLDCAYVPFDVPSVSKCDFITEQLHPVTEYANTFIVSSIPGRKSSTGFQIRVMATTLTDVAWAEISTTNPTAPVVKTPVTGVKRGQFTELTACRGSSATCIVMIACSQGCEVMQYGESNDMTPTGNEANKPDSTMITVPGLQHYTNDITFSTSKLYSVGGNQTLENVNGIIVVAKKSQLSSISLDGQALTTALTGGVDVTFPGALSATQPKVPGDTFTVISGGISPGFHRVTTTDPNVVYMVYVYGHAPSSSPSDSESYAYLGGMRFGQPDDLPVLEGPWFDFSQPVGGGPIVSNPGPGPENPNPPVTPTEFPSYQSIWEIRFYILNPHLNDLKTRNCSEAYYRYYMEERFYPKQKEIYQLAKDQCISSSGTVNVNMSHLLYYSEYTDGLIRFRLSLDGSGAVTFNNIMDCLQTLAENLSDMSTWVRTNYKDETSFLRPDAYYNKGCDPLHTSTPNFQSFYFGWNCATKNGGLGASKASGVQASMGVILGSLLLGSFLLILR